MIRRRPFTTRLLRFPGVMLQHYKLLRTRGTPIITSLRCAFDLARGVLS